MRSGPQALLVSRRMALTVLFSYRCSLSMMGDIQGLDCDLVNLPINFHRFYDLLR